MGNNELYYPASLVGEVLSQRALSLVGGVDGRDRDPALIGALSELANVAADLSLPNADRLRKLANVAAGGNTKDLERAALVCLIEAEK